MRHMKPKGVLLAILAFGLAGCASYHIQPVSSTELAKWHTGKLDEGYIFYQPELYFLVTPSASPSTTSNTAGTDKSSKPTPDKSTGLNVTPVYLPNPTMAYRVTTCNFLAKSDFAFNFKDGWQLS